jgi:hypothetical protein
MKSIKEKAKEYGLLNPDIHYDADGNTYDDVDKPSMDFEAGANYVLDVIEEFMKHNLVHSGNMKRLIEQLKK